MSTRFYYSVLLFVFILSFDFFAALNKGDEEGTNITTTPSPVASRIPGDISKQKCKEYAKYAYEKIQAPTLLLNPHFTKKLVCDIPRNRLVVGRSLAARREFPHMTLIGYIVRTGKLSWACGGSLISENYVLTAAHCLLSREHGSPKFVRVGFTNKSDPAHMQERTVSEIIPHSKFQPPLAYHDIGLLRVSKDIVFNTYVRPACLQTEKFIPYVSAIASGWGAASPIDTDGSNDLWATVLEFYDQDTCNRTFPQNLNLKDGIIDDLMICAGISKTLSAICEGDGGGPLQVYHQETEDVKCMYDIIGLISLSRRSCGLSTTISDVLTRVSAYIKWIEDIVWPN